jgi:hypothetical protein
VLPSTFPSAEGRDALRLKARRRIQIAYIAVFAVAVELVHATCGTYRSGYEHKKEEGDQQSKHKREINNRK